MNKIEYMNSEEVKLSSQLKEIFRDHCGIMIDGRIYTSIDSILEVDYLNHRYEAMCDFESQDDFDNDVKTLEFQRIGKLAYAIRFPDNQAVVENNFESVMGI